MSMIDDIRRDRKSGTAGPWDANPTHPVDGWNGWKLQQHLEDDYGADIGDIHGGQDNPTQKANARRIARLPDLEAAYLAEVESSKALVEALRVCEAELDAYSAQEYPYDHPVNVRYRKRDHDANPARLALAAYKGGGE